MGFFDLFKTSKPEESKQLSNEQYQSKRKKEIDILEKNMIYLPLKVSMQSLFQKRNRTYLTL